MSLFDLSTLEQKKLAAWQRSAPLQGFSSIEYRVDAYGLVIRWADYGTLTEYGWEIDHAIPSALGGFDILPNLRALHWRNNRSLGGVLGNALKR